MVCRDLFVLSVAAAAFFSGTAAFAQERDIRTERVRFEVGATWTRIEGSITGYEIMDYSLRAEAGQTMVVSMATNSGANYFNLLAPGETEIAFFNGSVHTNSFTGLLPETGDYTIRVYQMRSAARRQETALYTLQVEISPGDPKGSGHAAPLPTPDVMVPGTDFHATGTIPCARDSGQPMSICRFGVVREGDGSGFVTVFWPEGGNRVLSFVAGTPEGFDRSEPDGGAKMTVRKEADLFFVGIGDERFEIPEAVLVGG